MPITINVADGLLIIGNDLAVYSIALFAVPIVLLNQSWLYPARTPLNTTTVLSTTKANLDTGLYNWEVGVLTDAFL